MADLQDLKSYLDDILDELEEKQRKKRNYLSIAGEIESIYNRLAEDKKLIREYRNSIKTFSKEELSSFKGNLYSNSYKASMNTLLDDYDTVIGNIDTNLDRLNNARMQYENKAYQCNGPIGYLQSTANSVAHTIQNWFN